MKKKILIRLGISIVLIYSIFAIVNQQKALNQYNRETMELSKKIEDEKENNKELNEKKNNVNSLEFIEEKAREMLDMYYPNETIYINKGM